MAAQNSKYQNIDPGKLSILGIWESAMELK